VAFYIDSSAAVKLVFEEPESKALRDWLVDENVQLASSDLTRTELLRVTNRINPALVDRSKDLLSAIAIMKLGRELFEHAGRIEPRSLRSLDAIHIASALALGEDLEGLVVYDHRMAEAAERHSIQVVAPG
jgi:uncharacterized protein